MNHGNYSRKAGGVAGGGNDRRVECNRALCGFLPLLTLPDFPHIRTLPLLEDITLIGYDRSQDIDDDESDPPPTTGPFTSPALTETLELWM